MAAHVPQCAQVGWVEKGLFAFQDWIRDISKSNPAECAGWNQSRGGNSRAVETWQVQTDNWHSEFAARRQQLGHCRRWQFLKYGTSTAGLSVSLPKC
jgi:hypothetical protein